MKDRLILCTFMHLTKHQNYAQSRACSLHDRGDTASHNNHHRSTWRDSQSAYGLDRIIPLQSRKQECQLSIVVGAISAAHSHPSCRDRPIITAESRGSGQEVHERKLNDGISLMQGGCVVCCVCGKGFNQSRRIICG